MNKFYIVNIKFTNHNQHNTFTWPLNQSCLIQLFTWYNEYNTTTKYRTIKKYPAIVISSVIQSYVPYLKHDIGGIKWSSEVWVLRRQCGSLMIHLHYWRSSVFFINVINVVSCKWKEGSCPWNILPASYLTFNFGD